MEDSINTYKKYCTQCGKPVREKDKFCKWCGSILEEILEEEASNEEESIPVKTSSKIACKICGSFVLSDKSYCVECGALLESFESEMEMQNAAKKPKSVMIAVSLLWVSFVLGLLNFLLMDSSNIIFKSNYLISFFSTIFQVVVIYKISNGKNWARIFLLLSFIFSTIIIPLLYTIIINKSLLSPDVICLIVVQYVLNAIALYLIYTRPGSSWFHKVRTTATGNN